MGGENKQGCTRDSTDTRTVVPIDSHRLCPSLCGHPCACALYHLGLVQKGCVMVGGLCPTLFLLLILGSRWTTEQKLI